MMDKEKVNTMNIVRETHRLINDYPLLSYKEAFEKAKEIYGGK